jgi:hypothetical protein
MTRAEEDALLSDLAEAERHVRMAKWWKEGPDQAQADRAYVARLLRHALAIVEQEQ